MREVVQVPVAQGAGPDSLPGLSWTCDLDLGALLAALGVSERSAADEEAVAADAGTVREVTGVVADQLPAGPGLAAWIAGVDVSSAGEWDLPGVASAFRRVAAWAQAGELAAVAEMASRSGARDDHVHLDADGRPDQVTPAAGSTVGLELVMSHPAAMAWTGLGVTLRWRLPSTWAALSAGTIDLYRAKLIAEAVSPLDDELARAVEAAVLPGAGQQTSGQLRVALRRAVIAADPEGAEQRRQQAQRHAKVNLYPDPDADTATLAGTRLPSVHAAAAMARLTAIAQAMKSAGMAGGLDYLRAIAFVGLLLGTLPQVPPPANDPGPEGPTDPDPGEPGGPDGPGHGEPGDLDEPGPGPDSSGSGGLDPDGSSRGDPGSGETHGPSGPSGPGSVVSGPGGSGGGDQGGSGPVDSGDGSADNQHAPRPGPPNPPDPDPPDPEPPNPTPPDPDPGLDPEPDPDPGLDPEPDPPGDPDGEYAEDRDEDDGPFAPGPPAPMPPLPATADQAPPFLGQPPPGQPPGDQPRGHPPHRGHPPPAGQLPPGFPPLPCHPPPSGKTGRPPPGLLELVISWRALIGDPAGPARLSRVGPIIATQARLLALTAAADPYARWLVVVTDENGYAVAVEAVRRRHRAGWARPAGITGLVTVTIPAAVLAQLTGTRTNGPASTGTAGGGIRAAVLRAARRAAARARRQAAADAAAPGGCAHTNATAAYRPTTKIRDFVTARDQTCRNPRCRQPARHADLDHTTPWHKGGPTCGCNLGGECRRDHKLKQLPGWTLIQTAPGHFQLTTPAGRAYTTTPDPYPT